MVPTWSSALGTEYTSPPAFTSSDIAENQKQKNSHCTAFGKEVQPFIPPSSLLSNLPAPAPVRRDLKSQRALSLSVCLSARDVDIRVTFVYLWPALLIIDRQLIYIHATDDQPPLRLRTSSYIHTGSAVKHEASLDSTRLGHDETEA